MPTIFMLLLALALDGPERCTLTGTVVDSATGKGLSKVELLLRPVGRWTHMAATSTDAEGRFTMIELEAGAYRLTSRRSGYLESEYGKGSVLQLRSGEPVRVSHKMVPAGSISGTVRDSDGEPLEGVNVVIATRTAEYGRPQIDGYEVATTGDGGLYRTGGLPPGRYYVAATRWDDRSNAVDHSPAGVAERTATVMTFYAGATDASTATPVALRAGARVSGIDITVARRRAFRVAGRVKNAPEAPQQLALAPESPVARDRPFLTTTKNAEGEFEFRHVPAGSYLLHGTPVTVADNVDALTVDFAARAEIHGRITLEGERPNVRGLHVFITQDGRSGQMPELRADLTFSTRKVDPGLYEVRVSDGEPRRVYVKSIRSGDRDVLQEGLRVAGAVAPLEIVLSADGARVEGVVTDREGRPAPGATVVMIPPEGLRHRDDLYRTASADQLGRYALDPAAPGKYELWAWEDVEAGAWRDPEFLRGYDKRGEPVTLTANERKSVQVKALPVLP